MASPKSGKADEICCSYCVQSSVPAAKTCVHCAASMCEEHTKVHNKAAEHILMDPTSSIKDMKCPIHDKVIEFCCSKDGACICASCCIIGEHRGHKVDSLKDALEKRKAGFKDTMDALALESEENEKNLERLLNKRDNMNVELTGVTERVTALFRDMNEQLAALQARAMSEVARQEKQVMVRVNGLVQQLEKKKDELSKKMKHIEELQNMTNPLTVLRGTTQEEVKKRRGSRKGSECDNDIKVSSSIDEGPISLILHIGLLNFAECLQDLKALRQFTDVKKTSITLDVNTAQSKIIISSDLKTASHSAVSQKYPETPERFKSCQVLSTNAFTSGQHYWEVDVSEAPRWIIGVALKSIARKVAGNDSFLGYNNKSWTLFFQKFLGVSHNNVQNAVVSDFPVQGVGIYLDYDAGYMSFYQLNPTKHLHTFTATFHEPLHAAFYIFDNSCIKMKC